MKIEPQIANQHKRSHDEADCNEHKPAAYPLWAGMDIEHRRGEIQRVRSLAIRIQWQSVIGSTWNGNRCNWINGFSSSHRVPPASGGTEYVEPAPPVSIFLRACA